MATTTNIIEATREQFRKRLDELKPLLDEAEQIQQTLSLMESTGSTSGQTRRRGRRPKGEPTRKDEFLAIVRDNPGITVTGIAEKMGLKNQKNYLYRIASDLADEGLVKKDGREYTVSAGAPEPQEQEQTEPVPA